MAISKTRLKMMKVFALCGFVVASLLLGSSVARVDLGLLPLMLCPPIILALGLDKASLVVGTVGWLVIALCNSGIYAAAGFALSFLQHSTPDCER
jgi:hypothetical protein